MSKFFRSVALSSAFAVALAFAAIAVRARSGGSGHAQQVSQTPAAGQTPTGSAAPATGAARGRGIFREPDPIDFEDRTGYAEMFDGSTLNGWDGNPDVWKVADGAIVGERPMPPEGVPASRFAQTFLVWQGGEPADFELKLEIKLEGAGADSGIQYRSHIAPLNAGRAGAPPPDPAKRSGIWADINSISISRIRIPVRSRKASGAASSRFAGKWFAPRQGRIRD